MQQQYKQPMERIDVLEGGNRDLREAYTAQEGRLAQTTSDLASGRSSVSSLTAELRESAAERAPPFQATGAPSRVAPRRDAPPKTSRRFDPNGVRDEWAEISKWHSRAGERRPAEAVGPRDRNVLGGGGRACARGTDGLGRRGAG